MNSIIRINGLNAGYNKGNILNHVDLNVSERDFLGIIGPNGGGKTTLIKCMLQLHRPSGGSIRFYKNGREVSGINIGYLPQYSHIDRKFPITVYDTILSGLSGQKSLISRYTDTHHCAVHQTIALMGLEGLEQRAIGELSGGQLQRTLLGRALVSNPEAIILDEPDTYIDKRFESQLYALLHDINRHRAIILVSHDIGTVLKNAKSLAYVDGTLHYRPHTEAPAEWLEKYLKHPPQNLSTQ